MGDITVLLQKVQQGEPAAREQLITQLHSELTRLARFQLARESTISQLDPPALVNEAYLRLVGITDLPNDNRHAFMAYAASVMRSVIVDYARRRSRNKRGGDWQRVSMTHCGLEPEIADESGVDVGQLDSALQALRKLDERCHQIVELRYFAGMSIEQVAEALQLSPTTVKRDWRSARAFLRQALRP